MSDSKATVFLTNMAADHDYSPATRYGAIRPITRGNYPVFKTSRLIEEIATAIAQSEEGDYLLISGSAFVAALCMALWLSRHKSCQVLLYDNQQVAYVPRTVKREQLLLALARQLEDE